jgi:hypothetical protein
MRGKLQRRLKVKLKTNRPSQIPGHGAHQSGMIAPNVG